MASFYLPTEYVQEVYDKIMKFFSSLYQPVIKIMQFTIEKPDSYKNCVYILFISQKEKIHL